MRCVPPALPPYSPGRTSDSDDTEKENVSDVDLRQISGQKAPPADAADAKKSGFHE